MFKHHYKFFKYPEINCQKISLFPKFSELFLQVSLLTTTKGVRWKKVKHKINKNSHSISQSKTNKSLFTQNYVRNRSNFILHQNKWKMTNQRGEVKRGNRSVKILQQ